jgi:peroxin-6
VLIVFLRFTLHPTLSLSRVSEGLPFTYTGADMYALCSDAMLKAVTRQARAVDKKVQEYNSTHTPTISIAYFFDHLATDEDTAVMVTEQDFIEAHKELVPSVSADELRHYQRVRSQFEGAGKKDDNATPTATATNGNGNGNMQIMSGANKGKGKAPASRDESDMLIRTETMDVNANGNGRGSLAKGKGKASVGSHGSKNSVDIAEGGFGDAAQDDDLYG